MSTESKYIISEFYAFTADKNLIKEAIATNQAVRLKGILQKANTLNRNGRKYPFEILKREVDKYNELVRERRALGELDHPDSAVVSLANVSHLVTKMWWDGETLLGEVEILNTPSGDVLKGLLSNEVMLGISSRGVGSVKSHTEDVVQEDFELIAFDFVSSPSTPGAYMFKEGYEANKPGLKRITNDSYKTMRADVSESNNNAKSKKLLDLGNQDFWKKK